MSSEETKIQEKKDFIEGLTKYYKLKSKYQEKNDEEKRKIAKMPNKSWREKRRLFKAIQPKCIHCGSLGGTIFREGLDEAIGERVLKAMCGNRADPCPLDIQIHLGYFLGLEEALRDDESMIEDYKNQLIRAKNDLIFGYTTTEKALDIFDQVKRDLAEVTEIYEYELVRYATNKGEDSETLKKIRTTEEEIYNDIKTMHKTLHDYERTGNTMFVQDAVQFYNEELNEKVIELRQTKYPVCYVDHDEDDDTYHLIQKRYDVENVEQNFGKHLGVEKMVLTVVQREKPPQKTLKARKPAATRTRKNKPRIIEVEERPSIIQSLFPKEPIQEEPIQEEPTQEEPTQEEPKTQEPEKE